MLGVSRADLHGPGLAGRWIVLEQRRDGGTHKTNEQYRRFSAATVGGDQKSRPAKMEQAHPFDVPPS